LASQPGISWSLSDLKLLILLPLGEQLVVHFFFDLGLGAAFGRALGLAGEVVEADGLSARRREQESRRHHHNRNSGFSNRRLVSHGGDDSEARPPGKAPKRLS
jgi:hypothetical protein